MDDCACQFNPPHTPSVEIKDYISGTPGDPNAKFLSRRSKLDVMGRLGESTVTDPAGDIKQARNYGEWNQVTSVSTPYRDGEEPGYTQYSYWAPGYISGVASPDQTGVGYSYDRNNVRVSGDTGLVRNYVYQEDGKVGTVQEEDANNQLTIHTNYAYDALSRLITITQGVQTRSFTYDDLGRLKSETHPESGTTSYTYDLNSNVLTRTDARGIVTYYTYDALNRVTLKSYSNGTPSVSYWYDSAPPGSPISIANPVGRLTRITTTASGATVTNYYSYCNCSSVDREATVITDGTTRTYVTNYAYNYLGQTTSITYPNGKVVTYGRDDKGREVRVSSTIDGQSIKYVDSAEYLGPRGELTKVVYGISWPNWNNVETTYTYSPTTLRLTRLKTLGLDLSYSYRGTRPGVYWNSGRIYDITDNYEDPVNSYYHYEYDHWWRLTSYWESEGRYDNPPVLKYDWSYDRYGNMLSRTKYDETCPEGCPANTYNVDAATNRVLSSSPGGSYSYDLAGNRTGGGRTYDAENRLLGWTGTSIVYDGSSRRFRKVSGSSRIFYIYSAKGFMLVEDDWSAGTTKNQIYFNGQLLATHDEDDYVRLFFTDHLGSTRSIVTVTPSEDWGEDWETTAAYAYDPYRVKFADKERASNGLDYFGARYYDSSTTFRWISPDSLTARVYDPGSLNKYTYVRNDPVNLVDPDGRMAAPFDMPLLSWVTSTYWGTIDWLYGGEIPVTSTYLVTYVVLKATPEGGSPELTWNSLRSAADKMLKANNSDCLNWIRGLFTKYWTEKNNADPAAMAKTDINNFVRYLGVLDYSSGDAAAKFVPKKTVSVTTVAPNGTTFITVAEANFTTSTITFYQEFFGQSQTQQAQEFIHEGTHLEGYGDIQLAKLATGNDYATVETASVAYQNELVKHCK